MRTLQLLERWECILDAQPHRHFMIGVVLGKDGVDLWRFSKATGHMHSGIYPLNWDQGDTGWQVALLDWLLRLLLCHWDL